MQHVIKRQEMAKKRQNDTHMYVEGTFMKMGRGRRYKFEKI